MDPETHNAIKRIEKMLDWFEEKSEEFQEAIGQLDETTIKLIKRIEKLENPKN